MPLGLDTPVGEQGRELSRGQAQRVALARAFLKDAPLLLLDEPTAGLDAKNEHLVIDALKELTIGKTVLLVTHRLYNIENIDRILVMADGQIIEQGTYQNLLASTGALYDLIHNGS
jgi:ABC-type multidrug transport system fused ATPase/permease subunit